MSMGPSSRSMPGRPNEPFLWGRGGRRRTADDIALERRFAQQQMATGADASPVGHWTQGLARVANGLAGGCAEPIDRLKSLLELRARLPRLWPLAMPWRTAPILLPRPSSIPSFASLV
jgi:hypothetical protein